MEKFDLFLSPAQFWFKRVGLERMVREEKRFHVWEPSFVGENLAMGETEMH